MLAMYLFTVFTVFGLWALAMGFILTRRETVDGRALINGVLWSVLTVIVLVYLHFNLPR